MMNKRGIQREVLIGIIISVAALLVVFAFLGPLRYLFINTVTKETCHASVIAKSGEFPVLNKIPGTEYVFKEMPLKCKTQNISIETANEAQINKEITGALYDCWWMLGEGKYNFLSEGAWIELTSVGFNPKTTCLICSIIHFDKSISQQTPQVNLLKYLDTTPVPGKNVNYSEYFANQKGVALSTQTAIDPYVKTSQDYAVIFMGIKGQDFWEPLKKDLALALGLEGGNILLFKGAGIGTLTKGLLRFGMVLLPVQLFSQHMQGVMASAYCNGNLEGCYILNLVPYTPTELYEKCGNIESIP